MKVLMAGNVPIDLVSVKGGVETAILNLLSGFSTIKEIEIVFVSFTNELKDFKVIDFASNIKIYFIPLKVNFQLLDYLVNVQILRKIIKSENVQIIHIQSSSALLLRYWNFPINKIVVTQHGIKSEEIKYVKEIKKKLRVLFKVIVQRYYFPLFKNLIFISNYNKKLFRGKIYNAEVIYNAVNLSFFDKNNRIANNNSIIFVAGIMPRKNLDLILESLGELRKQKVFFSLEVVGGFVSKKYEKSILRKIEEYKISSQVTFHGWLNQEELIKVYKRCSIFTLPSLQETLPVSIAEAMALGKVVIASDVGAISEMFENEISGYLIKKNDAKDLIRILKILYNNNEIICRISNMAKKEAIRKFHPHSVAKKTNVFYKKVISMNQLK